MAFQCVGVCKLTLGTNEHAEIDADACDGLPPTLCTDIIAIAEKRCEAVYMSGRWW